MAIKNIKLYHYPATRSARVRWLLHELAVPFTEEVVPLYEGAQYQADYMSKNPNHAVPAVLLSFEDGREHCLLESGAIVTFLADAYKEVGLAPPVEDSLARADYLQMLYFGSSSLDMMLWQVRCHAHILPEPQRDSATLERYRNKFLNEAEPQLLDRLSRMAYICGDSFSAADCIIAHNILWAKSYSMCAHQGFDAYLARIMQRPGFQKGFDDAHQFTLELPEGAALARRFTG